MNPNDLVKKVVMELKTLHECGFRTWYSKALELTYRFNLKIELDHKTFKKHSKLLIRRDFIQNWSQEINDIIKNPILITYQLMKKDFELEPYLKLISNYKYRHAITKLRTSSHDLQIEKGRHTQLPLESRRCLYCNDIENEIHFLIKCKLFKAERIELYDRLSLDDFDRIVNQQDQFVYLMNSRNQRHLEILGAFIFKCFKKRKSFIDSLN